MTVFRCSFFFLYKNLYYIIIEKDFVQFKKQISDIKKDFVQFEKRKEKRKGKELCLRTGFVGI